MNIRLVKIIISVSLLCIAAGLAYRHIEKKVSRFDLPEGELKWSPVRPKKAKMCIPAAFTDTDGSISGLYRYDGNNFKSSKKFNMRVSLKGDLFYISRQWVSENGFKHLTLVYNSKPMKFYDSRRAIRRALCKDEKGAFILQSNYPMTLSEFASECGNAVPMPHTWIWENMDMATLRRITLSDLSTFGDSSLGISKQIGST